MKRRKEEKKKLLILLVTLIFEIVFMLFMTLFFPLNAWAVVGEDSVTVVTTLSVGNSPPEILNITINNGNSIDLTPNATTTIEVILHALDYNGEDDIQNVTAEFFDNVASAFGNADDKNNHYTNRSCSINKAYGDLNSVNASCKFNLEYYANNATWNFTATINDSFNLQDSLSQNQTVNALLALGLPNIIDYGLINSTNVSNESSVNITNFGNVRFNVTLQGYGRVLGDNLAMNCSLGSTQNISVYYEKYNLTSSNPGNLNLAQFESLYRNLSGSTTVRNLNLDQRTNDVVNDKTNTTYWRIYVPLGVAGSCTGNIIFGAVQSPET